jgi:hypothetical protein
MPRTGLFEANAAHWYHAEVAPPMGRRFSPLLQQ